MRTFVFRYQNILFSRSCSDWTRCQQKDLRRQIKRLFCFQNWLLQCRCKLDQLSASLPFLLLKSTWCRFTMKRVSALVTTCPLNCKSLFRHSGCLLLLITKLAQAREALEAKREEEQARLEVRRKNFEFSTFSKKNQEEEKKMPAGEGKQAGGKRGCKTQ